MEPPTPANDHNFGDAAPPPQGTVLYVRPLRMMAPSGGQPFFPPPNTHGSFNGFNPDFFSQGSQPDVFNRPKPSIIPEFPPVTRPKPSVSRDFPDVTRPGSSAVRDFPEGTGRNAWRNPTSRPGNAYASNTNTVHVQAENPAAEPCSTPDASLKSKKRNRKSSTPSNTKKVRRSAGKPSKPSPEGLNSVHPQKAVQVTLRLYDALRRHLLQEEEIKGKEAGKGRADLYAGSIINSRGLSINRSEKVVGPFPGVDVGNQFYFRMEIGCIGMHGPIQAGIEYLTSKESEWNTPVAISIISSGGYDDRDDGETLIYTGQGGKTADNKSNEDQKLERGNLAMEGSMKFQVPVRVIRGIKDASSPSGKTYTYDGMYKVEKCWSEKGKTGFEEFKFKLQRLPGQPELGSAVIKLTNHLKYKPSMRKGLRVEDISRGKENVPVCVVNTVDDDESPPFFEYSTKVQYPCGFSELQLPMGCECKGVCNASKGCLCFSRNGDKFAYLNSGVLVKEKDIVYECGSHCTCPPTCRNRLTQKGLKHRLEIFKTEMMGWGVRSWDSISAGSFVCEYTGKAINNMEVLQAMHNNDYMLNLRKGPNTKTCWGDVSGVVENQFSNTNPQTVRRQDLLVDASKMGNVTRFINHSCSPNLFAQPVLYDHHDFRFPHIMLFAMDNVPPLRELTLDYWSGELNTGSQVRSKDCLCGALDCRGKLHY